MLFLRGDPNADGFMNIGDCVFILMYLFLGAEASCPAAMDVDGNDLLDLSDPVGLLGFLFLGTAPPAPPYPFLGAHSFGDPLPCAR